MRHYVKFLAKLQPALQARLLQVVEDILSGRMDGLDVKKLKGTTDTFRVRVGNVRIVYQVADDAYYLVDITFRKDAYR